MRLNKGSDPKVESSRGLTPKRRLRVLIAYGPTQEPLDPVRYLTNRSTGTMGKALVAEAKRRGHRVTAVECPTDARTALDLLKKLKVLTPKHDVLIMVAAVADVRPAKMAAGKISKKDLKTIRLVKNPDILATLAKKKLKSQIFIGFGLESGSLIKRGQQKLTKKGLDWIILQNVSLRQNPFGNIKMDVVFFSKHHKIHKFNKISKLHCSRLALNILNN